MTTSTADRSRSRTTRSTFRTSCARTRAIQLAVAQRVAERIDPSLTAESLERLGDGVKSDVWRMTCSGGEQFAVKEFKADHADALRREVAFYAALGDPGDLPLPRLIAADESDEVLPHGYAVLSVVPGDSDRDEKYDLTHERRCELYRQLGAIQRELHARHGSAFGTLPITDDAFADNGSFVTWRIDRALRGFSEHGGNRYLAGRAREFFAARSAAFDRCTRPSLCHGDLHLANVLAEFDGDAGRITGVFDFESAFSGDPVMDLAQTYHSATVRDERLLAALLDGYGGLPDGAREAFDAYVVYFAFELWGYYASGGSRKPLRTIERDIARRIGAPVWRVERSRIRARVNG